MRDYQGIYDALRRKAKDPACTPREVEALNAKADEIKANHPEAFVPQPLRINDIITPDDFRDWLDKTYRADPYVDYRSAFRHRAEGKTGYSWYTAPPSSPPGAAAGKEYDPEHAQWDHSRNMAQGARHYTVYFDKKGEEPPDYSYTDISDLEDPQDGTGL
jgi:hypothetical protein